MIDSKPQPIIIPANPGFFLLSFYAGEDCDPIIERTPIIAWDISLAKYVQPDRGGPEGFWFAMPIAYTDHTDLRDIDAILEPINGGVYTPNNIDFDNERLWAAHMKTYTEKRNAP